jgi:hypothetical protein
MQFYELLLDLLIILTSVKTKSKTKVFPCVRATFFIMQWSEHGIRVGEYFIAAYYYQLNYEALIK